MSRRASNNASRIHIAMCLRVPAYLVLHDALVSQVEYIHINERGEDGETVSVRAQW